MRPARWVAAACAAGGAALLVASGDEEAAPASPQPALVRGCDSRGEPSGRPDSRSVPIGPVSLPAGFERSPASTFASRAEQVGFRRYLRGRRGRALPPSQRRRLARLASSHHETLKFPVHVQAGVRAVLAIAPADRRHAALLYGHGEGRQIGPHWSVRVSDGTAAVALQACPATEPRFSGPGTVGPHTGFPGAAVVAGARCVTFQVWIEGAGRPSEATLPFGVPGCPERATAR